MLTVEKTILFYFKGKSIDLVGADIEQMVLDTGRLFRWLEPDTKIAPEWRPDRINVHVNKNHIIKNVTVG